MRKTIPMLFLLSALAAAGLAQDGAPPRDLAQVRADFEAAALRCDDARLGEVADELAQERTPDGERARLPAERELVRLEALFHQANALRNRRMILEPENSSELKDRQVAIAEVAEEEARALLERLPEHPRLWSLLGEFVALRITGPNGAFIGPKAADAIDRALLLDPADPRAELAAGRRYLYTPGAFGGSDSAALEHLERAERLVNAREREIVERLRETRSEELGDPARRRDVLRGIAEEARRSAWRLHDEILVHLAVAYRDAGRTRRAEVALRRALAANPESEPARALLERLPKDETR